MGQLRAEVASTYNAQSWNPQIIASKLTGNLLAGSVNEERDFSRTPVLTEQHVIFPAPAPPQAEMQTLNLTRRILFGNAMAGGINPNDVFPMRLMTFALLQGTLSPRWGLCRHPGGDFNWGSIAHYWTVWTPQKETAAEYRQWATRRSPNADTCIIQIQIPQSFMQSLRIQDLWYSPNWKEYVWTWRKMERPKRNSTVSGDLGKSTLSKATSALP
ncbi:hypothetical protein CNMCM5793_005078 [Aspergillus hiratsukae]|uniref:Uncharacterized protein n=1 Tax=Aspergillus hiratsukae TaxID=1194566 RepID=A0A8H6QEN0_9EURO|nr:hypothetical protein CNMCM5793_005078 [Aspergillus hiratsukae]KAF7170572.1 hypothetical protein CNMCM6106_005229 [Aspergillus hiratsukae]